MQFRQSTVEDSEVAADAAAVQQAGGELHADVAAALPAHLAAASDAAVRRELQHELGGRQPGDPEREPGARIGHVLDKALLNTRARPEIDPGALADLPSLGSALLNRHQRWPCP